MDWSCGWLRRYASNLELVHITSPEGALAKKRCKGTEFSINWKICSDIETPSRCKWAITDVVEAFRDDVRVDVGAGVRPLPSDNSRPGTSSSSRIDRERETPGDAGIDEKRLDFDFGTRILLGADEPAALRPW